MDCGALGDKGILSPNPSITGESSKVLQMAGQAKEFKFIEAVTE